MKTLIPWFLILFVAYVLQSSLFNVIAYDGISVDLVLLTTVYFSILYDKYALLYGFCAGLFLDIASGAFLGMYTFSLLLICILINQFSKRFYKENIFLPLVASLFATVFNYFIIAVIIFLLGYNYNIWLAINNMLVTLIYNLIFAYPVYFLVIKIDRNLQQLIKKNQQF